ncbi:MAG: T9SS type A sorting domain-containing protein, partial [bacterium]
GSSDTQTNQVVLINLNDKKNYTVVEPAGSGFLSMQFSPDGKRIASLHTGGNPSDIYIYIYHLETKEKKKITYYEISALFGFDIAGIGKPLFIDSNILYTGISDESDKIKYNFTWNIPENRVKNYINFNYARSFDFKDSLILLCNQAGVVAFLNKNIVPVQEGLVINESYLKYNNNQLEFFSNQNFTGESVVYDTTGKLIVDLGSQPFITGKNIITINQTLNIGIYILTINTGSEQFSFKFIVENK